MPHPHHHFYHDSYFHSPRGERFGIEGGPGCNGYGPDAERQRAHKRERMFEAGGLKLLALYLIAQQPSHGYDIIRAIGELVGATTSPAWHYLPCAERAGRHGPSHGD
ncbi:MAG: PadR family transcriptional regulator [Comamonas sp.]